MVRCAGRVEERLVATGQIRIGLEITGDKFGMLSCGEILRSLKDPISYKASTSQNFPQNRVSAR
jgi:hypothetical protein